MARKKTPKKPDVVRPAANEDNINKAASENSCHVTSGLREVRQCYEDARRRATEQIREAREMTLGDLFDHTIVAAKRHPRCSLAIATAFGFFLGRLFRR